MKVVLTVKNGVTSPKQRSNQKPGQAVSANSVHLYLPQEVHAKLNEVAVLNKRSLSSVAAEMVEFALDALRDGDAKLGDAGMQRSTQNGTFADIAEESLKRIVPELSYGEHRPGAPRIYRSQEEKWVEERRAKLGK